MYRYTVRCEFCQEDALETVNRWLNWLREPHIAEVMQGGATAAEVVKMSAKVPTYEIRYQFASRQEFEQYQSESAPRLKAEGLQLFPPEALGMVYSRTDGEVIFRCKR